MTRHLPRVVVAVAATVVALAVAARLSGHRADRRVAPAAAATATVTDATTVATEFLVALLRADRKHPHGDLAQLRRTCTPAFFDQLRTVAASPPWTTEASGATWSGVVLSAATRVEGEHASSLVTATVDEHLPSRPETRTAVAFTVTLRHDGFEWRVDGVRP